MTSRGFSQTIIFGLVGLVLLVAVFFSLSSKKTLDQIVTITPAATSSPAEAASQPTSTAAAKPSTPKPTKPVSPTSGSVGGTTVTVPVVPATQPSTPPPAAPVEPPAPTPTPAPAPAAWSPGFQAAKRTYSEIPSENERATLPACDGKSFSILPINMSSVASIASGNSAGTASPAEYETFTLNSKGVNSLYALTFPADVYVTNVVQEQGITSDPEDSTVYFALCKDVIGYATNIKELSTQVYKFVTDSPCLGKPQTGPNACHVEVLTLVGRGSPIGNVGKTGGTFGFGLIDLRASRNLANPDQYGHPARMEFAACPFTYFTDASNFSAKLAAGDSLCSAH